jgi:putative sterol carrier protein
LEVTTDAHTFVQIGTGMLTPLQAVLSGQLKMMGDNDAIARCSALLGLDG